MDVSVKETQIKAGSKQRKSTFLDLVTAKSDPKFELPSFVSPLGPTESVMAWNLALQDVFLPLKGWRTDMTC